MKARIILFSAVLLTTACAAPPASIPVTIEVTRSVEVTSLVEVTRIVERVVTPTPRPTPMPTATPQGAEVGSRTNPHFVGQAASLVLGGKLEFTLTVVEVLRGDVAYARILQANQFNDPAPAGFEFILAHIEVEYTGSDQGVLQVSKSDFAVITKGRAIRYVDTFTYSPCCLQPDLELSLFQGGSGDGWIALPVAVDDTDPLLAIGLRADGSGGVFFSLTPLD
jgi:hypothetical protein